MTTSPDARCQTCSTPTKAGACSRPRRRPGAAGGRISASGNGARCARITAPDGNAWDYLPHDHARSRAYRWGEDGIAGFGDDQLNWCLGAGAVERPRPDPEGAPVRPDQCRGQPRRGRQGTLLLPRRHADPLLHADALQVSAGRLPLRPAGRGEPPARRATDREFELVDTGVFDDDRYFDVYGRIRQGAPDDILMRVTVDNRAAGAGALHVLPQLWARNTWSWTARRNAPAAARAGRTARSCAEHPAMPPMRPALIEPAARAAVLRERDQYAPAVRRGRPPATSRTGSTTTSCTAIATRSIRLHEGTQVRGPRRARHRSQAAAATIRLRFGSPTADSGRPSPISTRSSRRGSAEADAVLRRAAAGHRRSRRARWCSARRWPACSGPSSSTTSTCAAG